MIECADKYEEQLKDLKAINNDCYKINIPFKPVRRIMVSTYNGEIIGRIDLIINEAAQAVFDIAITRLSSNNGYIFAKDCMTGVRYLMDNYRKISFIVVIGSPVEKTYDRLAKLFGWRIAGVFEKQVLNIHGEWKDIKYYEWINPNWSEHEH